MSLVLVLVSCSAARPTAIGPTGPHDLTRYVLIIEQTPDGQTAHSWKPVKDVDLTKYHYSMKYPRMDELLQLTSSTPMTDDQIGEACYQVYERCMRRCLTSPLPPHASHYLASRKSMKAALQAFCMDECAKERDSCRKELERKAKEALEFHDVDRAVDWLKRHKEELLLGSVVVVAGVAFAVFICGSGGCLILVPVVLVASHGFSTDPYLLGASK
jgi:hypothetical protein